MLFRSSVPGAPVVRASLRRAERDDSHERRAMALMENAAMWAVAHALPEGSTTVGGSMTSSHLRPSKIGTLIAATALLEKIEGRKLTFRVEARQHGTVIGEGVHVRFIVDRETFLAKLG